MWKGFTLFLVITASILGARVLPTPKKAPYGSWKSPITADSLAEKSVKLGSIFYADQQGIYFSELRPSEKGRMVLVCKWADKQFEDLIPEKYNARSAVHEYGGGSQLMVGDEIYFSHFSDQQLYRRDAKGNISQLTHQPNSRFADGCCWNNRLYYVMEAQGETVENSLVSIDRTTGQVTRIAEGADFYASPRVSLDGKELAYYCWNHPNLPWDGGELRVAALREDGTLGETRVVAGGPSESINQFLWGPDQRLYFISDASGWWNLYRENKGKKESLYPLDAEFASPQWVFGQSFFQFWGKDKIVCVYSQLGIDRLALLEKRSLNPIDIPFTSIKGLYVSGDTLYFKGSSPTHPTAFIKCDLKTKKWEIVKQCIEREVNSSYLSIPAPIEFPTTGGYTAFAFYYPPQNRIYEGLDNESPPLLVLSHGGPTANTDTEYHPEIQYWTSRGIAVVDVNYGGSSGYGRAYRNRLVGNWGVVDVDDCTNAALYCAKMGLADRNRLAIAGGSAGGYTTLACLAFRNIFRAGISYFGISDLETLAHHMHKFESRYLDTLVGPYPESRDLYVERSPIHHVDQIMCPILLLQGDEDKVVPPAQSEKMYQSLLERGVPTAYLLFKQEQHGFRQAASIKRSLEAQAYFLSKIFGFRLADAVEPLEIANFDENDTD